MPEAKNISVRTNAHEELIDVTGPVKKAVAESGVSDGFIICFVPHTTAAVTINENADPDVRHDIIYKLAKDIPHRDSGYHHAEGNSDAHVKASLVGSSVQVLLQHGQLILGTWQGIYFCEFDGPRQRRLIVRVFASD